MKANELKKLYSADPFRPFVLVLQGGDRIEVIDRERVAIAPGGRWVHVFDPSGHGRFVELRTVADVRLKPGSGHNGYRGRRKAG